MTARPPDAAHVTSGGRAVTPRDLGAGAPASYAGAGPLPPCVLEAWTQDIGCVVMPRASCTTMERPRIGAALPWIPCCRMRAAGGLTTLSCRRGVSAGGTPARLRTGRQALLRKGSCP
ncbi:hypothetical protein SBRY_40554 [Actinacidiphila bryophytorum]|uniref:Uncharacterized protein n=1 Tax=Actinacidiphila bryophytorum TaxID=1436133 RepID=A0A9W4H3B7_9ACTN|nr:hypothetical protein SBRY_40554 [Actinacidiphila bryophytorum]